MPDVLDVLGVAAVRCRVERLDHGAAVGHDLAARCRHRRHPPVAVGSDLLAPAHVDLIARTVDEMTVAVARGARSAGSCRSRTSARRPPATCSAAAGQLLGISPSPRRYHLERQLDRQPLDTSDRAAVQIELEEPVGVREPLVPHLVRLGHEDARAGVGERGEQRSSRSRPSGRPRPARRSDRGSRTSARSARPTPSRSAPRGSSRRM